MIVHGEEIRWLPFTNKETVRAVCGENYATINHKVGVKLSKELIKSNGDVILIGAYVPPKGSPSMGTWIQIVTYQFWKTVCWIFQSNTPGHT